VPVRRRTVGRDLALFADRYNGQRRHAGLAGATPDEFYSERLPAHRRHEVLARLQRFAE
jgi:hypothetical protein